MPIPTFTEDDFGWNEKHNGTVPCAEGRLWQAINGSLGIFLANYVNEEIPFSYSIDPAAYNLESNAFNIFEITPGKKEFLGTLKGKIERTEMLGANKLKVIEITPVTR